MHLPLNIIKPWQSNISDHSYFMDDGPVFSFYKKKIKLGYPMCCLTKKKKKKLMCRCESWKRIRHNRFCSIKSYKLKKKKIRR